MTDVHGERAACKRVVLDSLHYNDERAFAALAELFTADAELYRPGQTAEPLRGRAAILAQYASRPALRLTRHLCSNLRVSLLEEGRARAHCYVLVFAADGAAPPVEHFGPACEPRLLIGELDDELVRTEAGWRIRCRRARFSMHRQ